MSRELQLTQDKIAIVDEEDYNFLRHFRWCAVKKDNVWYAATHIKIAPNRHQIAYMHRMVMGARKGQKVDHKNGNGLDNRKRDRTAQGGEEGNLRFCTQSQNRANCRKIDKSRNTSKFRGVSWHRGMKKWASVIRKDGVNYHLGYFRSEEAAARMYDFASVRLNGEFALINFPTKANPRV